MLSRVIRRAKKKKKKKKKKSKKSSVMQSIERDVIGDHFWHVEIRGTARVTGSVNIDRRATNDKTESPREINDASFFMVN